jgi:hypothetical protein
LPATRLRADGPGPALTSLGRLTGQNGGVDIGFEERQIAVGAAEAAVAERLAGQETITKWGLCGWLHRLLSGLHARIPPAKQVAEITV